MLLFFVDITSVCMPFKFVYQKEFSKGFRIVLFCPKSQIRTLSNIGGLKGTSGFNIYDLTLTRHIIEIIVTMV